MRNDAACVETQCIASLPCYGMGDTVASLQDSLAATIP
ncbi:hypothetical protein Barb4_00659 [Bacteroidales bacterium Barb4]|nr:hypothetical protein Barb4_00659 [Bacteroidales bacterium Barb4]